MEKILILMLLILIGCNLPDSVDPSAFNNENNSVPDDAPAKWEHSRFPLPIKIDSSYEDNEKVLIEDMLVNWEVAVSNQIDFFPEQISSTSKKDSTNIKDFHDQVIGIYKSDDWFPSSQIGGSYVLAVTQFFGNYNGSYTSITHADIIVNFRDFIFSIDQSISYDLPSVILHEIGHLLGLDHNYENEDSVMQPSIGFGEVLRTPTSVDEENMTNNYLQNQKSLSSHSISKEKINIPVRIIHELNADGFCYHTVNGKIKKIHRAKIH